MRAEIVKLHSMENIIKEMKSALSGVAKEAYIYGSAARGTAIKYESDVDLFIIPKKKIGMKDAFDILDSAHEKLLSMGLALHIVIYDRKRYSEEFLEEARKGIRIV